MDLWREFHGPNAGYVLELYDRYRADPQSVDAATAAFFERWTPPDSQVREASATSAANAATPEPGLASVTSPATDKLVAALALAHDIRAQGHLVAWLDPLQDAPAQAQLPPPPGLTDDDLRLLPATYIGGPVANQAANALEALAHLRSIYCHTTGYDYEPLVDAAERAWLQEAIEGGHYRPPQMPGEPLRLLERLTQVEVFEHFLQRTFPGKTRFSIEGVDVLIPMLDEIAGAAVVASIGLVVIGMAHRGRLNVLTHILQKPYAQILAEFRDVARDSAITTESGWTGDVKYHAGLCQPEAAPDNGRLTICLPPNPSHLEAINPVIVGMARAADTDVSAPGAPKINMDGALPVIIHGDASFSGQGIAAETLNLSQLPGYQTGGTLHIITNNQLGFTALASEMRSSHYASDLAQGYKIPVIHVNADDPEAALEAIRLALAYRARFHKDFLIDLVGYRRYGHNEGDEPSFTQPAMYRQIQAHPTVRALWAQTLRERGLITAQWPEALVKEGLDKLQAIYDTVKAAESPGPEPVSLVHDHPRPIPTKVPLARLQALNQALLTVPADFELNRKLENLFRQRQQAFDDPHRASLDWPLAEALAFATILQDGIAIRLTGEDVTRGTFSQRHTVLYDAQTGRAFTPLQSLPQAQAAYEVHNSPVTETATQGFEFGYNLQEPGRLVIWEAQYGDFANVAQATIDEFLASAWAKWQQRPSLVFLLPHGNEGQGPDHSSARPERFLQLAADHNLRVVNPTTAAQCFHILRQQALQLATHPDPLIVLTPKGLLRHPLTASAPDALAEGEWQPVIDAAPPSAPEAVRRLVLCSGRIFVDLFTGQAQHNPEQDMAVVRLEQLCPFPAAELGQVLQRYPALEAVVWVQEEPRNMGAWETLRPCLLDLIDGRWPLYCVARPASSSPAEGSTSLYAIHQRALVKQAFGPELVC
jgi:2-oxoglutarate dehydrogenase E1 component